MAHKPEGDAWHSYFEPGTEVLRNVRGIRDQSTLSAYERTRSHAAFVDLRRREPPQHFDLSYLQSCHRELFRQVYPWAGQLRYVDIFKPGDPRGFVHHGHITTRFEGLTEQLRREGELRSCTDPVQWADRAGYYWGQVNNIHPFREGNGRSARLYLTHLAKAAGHDLDWQRIQRDLGHEAVNMASRVAAGGEYEPMRQLLQYAATGEHDRSASPRQHLDFLDRQLGQELDSQLAIRTGNAHPREAQYLDQARQSANRVLAVLPSQYPSRGQQPHPPGTGPERTARTTARSRADQERTAYRAREAHYQTGNRGYGR